MGLPAGLVLGVRRELGQGLKQNKCPCPALPTAVPLGQGCALPKAAAAGGARLRSTVGTPTLGWVPGSCWH